MPCPPTNPSCVYTAAKYHNYRFCEQPFYLAHRRTPRFPPSYCAIEVHVASFYAHRFCFDCLSSKWPHPPQHMYLHLVGESFHCTSTATRTLSVRLSPLPNTHTRSWQNDATSLAAKRSGGALATAATTVHAFFLKNSSSGISSANYL